LAIIKHFKSGLLFVLIGSALAFAQDEDAVPGPSEQQLEGTPVVALPGRNMLLLWSKEHGYVTLEGTAKAIDRMELKFPKKQIRASGAFIAKGPEKAFALASFTTTENPTRLPPVVAAPSDLSQRQPAVSRVHLEGEIEHCFDRGYRMEIVMRVGSQPVLIFLRTSNASFMASLRAGQRVGVTGYLWDRLHENPKFPLTVAVTKKQQIEILRPSPDPAETPLYQPGETTGETRRFLAMKPLGIDEQGRVVLRQKDSTLTVAFDPGPVNLSRWDIRPNHRYNLTAEVLGEQRGILGLKNRRIEIEAKDNPPVQVLDFDPLRPPPVGSRARFNGFVQGVSVRNKGDLAVEILADRKDGSQERSVTVICKNVWSNWPDLDLQRNDKVLVAGLYQGANPDNKQQEIVIWESNQLSIVSPTRSGKNWLPVVFTLAGGLLLSILWVTMLRRAIRQRTKDALDSEAKLRTVYQSVPQGIVAVAPDGEVFNINRALYELFQLDPGMEVGTFAQLCGTLGERVEDREKWGRFLRQVQEGQHEQTTQVVLKAVAGGTPRQIEIQVAPIAYDEAEGQLWIFRDLTETRELESSLAQSRKLEAVGRLTGGIAHDFNNLLTGVTGNLSMLEYELEKEPHLQEYVQGASEAAQHAAELVRRLLDYTKQTRLEVKRCSANDILTKLLRFLRHSLDSRVAIDLRLSDELLPTRVDPVKIEQVLMNLVINAIDAMPGGGTLTIQTRNSNDLDDPGLPAVTISITDDGTGIPPELLERIFEPYFTTKSVDGNGLGLPTSRGIIEQHGGKLTCVSVPGKGSTFKVILPASPETAEPTEATSPQEEAGAAATKQAESRQDKPSDGAGKTHVVIIEDEKMVRRLMHNMLTRSGFEVAEFPNGKEAMDYIHTASDRIDLVVSDNSMPVMDGIETFAQVRNNYPDIPFVVASGYLIDLKDYAARTDGSPPEAFLQKPLNFGSFTKTVKRVLAASAR